MDRILYVFYPRFGGSTPCVLRNPRTENSPDARSVFCRRGIHPSGVRMNSAVCVLNRLVVGTGVQATTHDVQPVFPSAINAETYSRVVC